jgi:hypothetical protein
MVRPVALLFLPILLVGCNRATYAGTAVWVDGSSGKTESRPVEVTIECGDWCNVDVVTCFGDCEPADQAGELTTCPAFHTACDYSEDGHSCDLGLAACTFSSGGAHLRADLVAGGIHFADHELRSTWQVSDADTGHALNEMTIDIAYDDPPPGDR